MTRLPFAPSLFAAALIATPFLSFPSPARADDSAAQAIAGKFAAAAEEEAKKRAAAEKAAAEKAAAEAEARKRAETQKAAAAEAEAKKRAEQAAEEDEIEMLTQARREAAERTAAEAAAKADEQRQADEARKAEEARVAAEQREKQAAEQRERQAAEQREKQAEEARLAEEARMKQMEADREEEARRLTEKLKRVAAERERRAAEALARKDAAPAPEQSLAERTKPITEDTAPPAATAEAPQAPPSAARETVPPSATAELPWQSAPPVARAPDTADIGVRPAPALAMSSRVTVLLILDTATGPPYRPVRTNANPVLCIGQSCWISAGSDRRAVEMPRIKALGPFNTLGARAGACNRKRACVFRDVDLDGIRAELQPIDLGFLRHIRHQPLAVDPDRSCDLAGNALVCGTTLRGDGWRAWVIPEATAVTAGPIALKAAVDRGLPSARAASLTAPVER